MIGPGYWTTGITIAKRGHQWHATLEFFDDGFATDGATEGTLRSRYWENDLAAMLDTLIADAKTLGIRLGAATSAPTVYAERDGELDSGDSPGLRRIANEQARRVGWDPAYSEALLVVSDSSGS